MGRRAWRCQAEAGRESGRGLRELALRRGLGGGAEDSTRAPGGKDGKEATASMVIGVAILGGFCRILDDFDGFWMILDGFNIAVENHHLYIMGNITISMATFNSYVKLPEGSYPRWIL